MKKSELKILIKECMKELVEQGIFDQQINMIVESKIQNKELLKENINVKHSKDELRNLIKNAVGANSKFADAFLDTAVNTLPKQLAKETDLNIGGAAAKIKSIITEGSGYDDEVKREDDAKMDLLTGGNMDRWRKLAFSSKRKIE